MSDTYESCTVGRDFIETLEYRRFAEFCDECRRYRYIGLCYGQSGVGKTLSARHYTGWQTIQNVDVCNIPDDVLISLARACRLDTVLYTASVVNTPRNLVEGITHARFLLHRIAHEPALRKHTAVIRRKQRKYTRELEAHFDRQDWMKLDGPPVAPPPRPPYTELAEEFARRENGMADPTNLVLIDEADRLRMASLEMARDIFDRNEIGLVLIGMPGMERRLARYPQFYSRIGFVHEFRRLSASELRKLLERAWTPPGVHLPPMDEETIAAVVRITGGNFRLLDRLLAQTERILEINQIPEVTLQAVEAARASLVIGHTG
ncbi:MAG TPA: AAA family ATPase [Armatimonadota bacterium]|jgi:hypothetical protein